MPHVHNSEEFPVNLLDALSLLYFIPFHEAIVKNIYVTLQSILDSSFPFNF